MRRRPPASSRSCRATRPSAGSPRPRTPTSGSSAARPSRTAEIFATNATLQAPRQLTHTHKEIDAYAWTSGRTLIDFYNDKKDKAHPKGEHLQATLYLPADYVKGKSYPTIVYIYERLTQDTNTFNRPAVPGTGFNRAFYTSNGYAVLEPDIKYLRKRSGYVGGVGDCAGGQGGDRDRCRRSGARRAARPLLGRVPDGVHDHADERVQGRRRGRAVDGHDQHVPLLYKNTGGTNGAIFERSQGRFTTGPWDNWDAYTRNSPVRYAKNVTSPLLMLHNDADGAVDFTQGVEYFNTLRRLGKPVWLVEYPGENHGLARQPNMQDYMIRMKEFFDHYLMEKPAPKWMTDGIPRLKMADDITERLKAREEAKKKKGGG